MKIRWVAILAAVVSAGLPAVSFANGKAVLAVISLLADVKELTTGLTLNQTAADTICKVTVAGVESVIHNPVSTGIFSASSNCDLDAAGAHASANAQATVGDWEPLSAKGTVLTSKPTVATVPATSPVHLSALAEATAAINGHVTATRKIAAGAPPAPAAAAAPALLSVRFQDVAASAGSEGFSFRFGIDFADGSAYQDIVFASGTIGGSGSTIELPYLESTDPALASQVRQQFLSAFAADAIGNILVSDFVLGSGLLPTGPEGVAGFAFASTLDEEYTVTGVATDIAYASVPEPETLALIVSSLAALVAVSRRGVSRRSHAAAPGTA